MLNPLLASSARRRMRTIRTPLILTLYALLPLCFSCVSALNMSRDTLLISDMRSSVEWYILLIVLQFFLIVLVAPAMTAGSISGERERQTLELLLVTNTGSLRIVLGKLMESLGFLILVVLSGLPMTCVVLVTGGLSLGHALLSLLFLLTCAFAAAAVGLFASALYKKTVAATVTAYLMIFALGIGTLLPLFTGVSPALTNALSSPQGIAGLTSDQLLRMVPPLMYLSPGLGLVALLMDQTGLLHSTFSSFGSGYYYYDLMEAFSFHRFALINMGAMLAAGALLTGLSALLVRPRALPRKRKRL